MGRCPRLGWRCAFGAQGRESIPPSFKEWQTQSCYTRRAQTIQGHRPVLIPAWAIGLFACDEHARRARTIQGHRPVSIPAWAIGPGQPPVRTGGLKARSIVAVILGSGIPSPIESGLQPLMGRGTFIPGALPQAGMAVRLWRSEVIGNIPFTLLPHSNQQRMFQAPPSGGSEHGHHVCTSLPWVPKPDNSRQV